MATRIAPIATWLQDNWRWLLVLSVLPLFTSKALYHLPLLIMALLGLNHVVRHWRALIDDQAACFILGVFLALWLPQVLALIGAVAPAASLRVSATYIGYPLAALFVLTAVRPARQYERLMLGVACVITLWAVDIFASAAGLVSRAPDPRYMADSLLGRLSLGHVVAVLSPLLFELVRRHYRQWPWLWLLILMVLAIVLLSGRRVAWLLLLLAAAAYVVYLAWLTRRRPGWRTVMPLLLMVVITASLYWQHEPTRQRMHETAGLFTTDMERVDQATSQRLDIWSTAWHMARDNWHNGIGVRGFRHAYADYAAADDFWLQLGVDVTHPHLFMLEIASETGLPGLIGYLLVWWLLWRTLSRATAGDPDGWIWPGAIALGLALFPLNAHLALYGSYWSAVLWWLTGLYAAAVSRSHPRT